MLHRVHRVALIGAVLALPVISGCAAASLLLHRDLKPPSIEFTASRLTKLSFESVSFEFDITVQNPNRIGVLLAGYDFDLSVRDVTLVTAQQSMNRAIPARSETTLSIPITVRYADVYGAVAGLADRDGTVYRIEAGARLRAPFIGEARVPVSHEGRLPLVRPATVRFDGIRVRRLSAQDADVTLRLAVANPNGFGLEVERVRVSVEVDGVPWATEDSAPGASIFAHDEGVVEVPVSIRFAGLSEGARSLLRSEEPIALRVAGELGITATEALPMNVSFPFDLSATTILGK